jgi:mRNA-degrading endonuclease RelE of RelBE toxin-antitoxin system
LIYQIRREFKKCRNKLTDKQLKQLHNAVESVENIIEDEIDLRTDERVREFFRVKRADEGVQQ